MAMIVNGNVMQVDIKMPMHIVSFANQEAIQLLQPLLRAQNVLQEAIPQLMGSVLKICVQAVSKEQFQQLWV